MSSSRTKKINTNKGDRQAKKEKKEARRQVIKRGGNCVRSDYVMRQISITVTKTMWSYINNLMLVLSTLIYNNNELATCGQRKGGWKKESKHTQPKNREIIKNKFTICLSSRRSRQM